MFLILQDLEKAGGRRVDTKGQSPRERETTDPGVSGSASGAAMPTGGASARPAPEV